MRAAGSNVQAEFAMQPSSQNDSGFRAPTNQVEQVLAEMWSRILDIERVGIGDDFFRSGGDSLCAAQVVVEIEKRFGLKLAVSSLLATPTIERLAQVIAARPQNGPAEERILRLQPLGTRPPFFCVHPVGGTVMCYAELARHMLPEQPFIGIRSVPGQEEANVEAMARRYATDVRHVQPHGPYFLGGYSFGGSVAFEMAQQLTQQGERVALLAIMDHTPPSVRYDRRYGTLSYWIEFFGNLPHWVVDDVLLAEPGELTRRLRLKLRALFRRFRHKAATPLARPQEIEQLFDLDRMPEHFQRLLTAHYAALRAYRPRPYAGPITLFRARARPLLRLHGRDLGWGPLAQQSLKTVIVPGNHMTMLKTPHVQVLAHRLTECLREAQASLLPD